MNLVCVSCHKYQFFNFFLMANDEFGVKMIYPSKTNGEAWTIDTSPMNDGRISIQGDGGTITYNATTQDFKISQEVNARIGVMTSAGFSQTNMTVNHNVLLERGYYHTDKDWKNVEVTMYFKYSGTTDTDLVFYTRTGRHNSAFKCEGFAYKCAFNLLTGKVK